MITPPAGPTLLGVDVILVGSVLAGIAAAAMVFAIYNAVTVRDPMAKRVKALNARREELKAGIIKGSGKKRQSVLRRSAHKATPPRLERVRMGQHMLDLTKRALHDDTGNDVAVTAGEFDLLKLFAENPNRPLSRDWLLETTSHRTRDPFDRAIDLRITRIRRKIEPAPDKPTVIRTVRGVGYMFVPPAE